MKDTHGFVHDAASSVGAQVWWQFHLSTNGFSKKVVGPFAELNSKYVSKFCLVFVLKPLFQNIVPCLVVPTRLDGVQCLQIVFVCDVHAIWVTKSVCLTETGNSFLKAVAQLDTFPYPSFVGGADEFKSHSDLYKMAKRNLISLISSGKINCKTSQL